jgi:uncharacterized glyoxalase superfamily metalloenzyme YdcJ
MQGQLPLWRLRGEFAVRLAALYGAEVPAYNTLVEVSKEVNSNFVKANGADAERLGSIERVTAERHGAIRVGSPTELAQVARIFAGFGMHAVGFYDLRDASKSSVPVVSTAFRPIEADELARNPFRVFTSMLVSNDPRFFDEATQDRLEAFISQRQLFSPRLLELADLSTTQHGLAPMHATEFLALATAAFKLSDTPIDRQWYRHLESISAVAADIGGVSSTHINHLTPRVLDIDELYRRMEARGIVMIDEIQGPPRWDGPDVLLRQTSFKALAEPRRFREPDGSVVTGALRVRFGEVEQRGIALTVAGRDLYDEMVAATDDRLAHSDATRAQVAQGVWREYLPKTEHDLAQRGLGFFTYRVADPTTAPSGRASIAELLRSGAIVAEPIVYEDFLPRSAAGIFQSNLTEEGARDDARAGVEYDLDRLATVIGHEIHDPNVLYQGLQAASISALEDELGITIEPAQAQPTQYRHEEQ